MKPFILVNKEGQKEILNLHQVLFIARDPQSLHSLSFYFPGVVYKSHFDSQEQMDNIMNNVIEAMNS